MHDLEQRLNATREGYDDEIIRHKFKIDAYTGAGGFSGYVRQTPGSFWGPAADIYSSANAGRRTPQSIDSYIVQYPREEEAKYQSRVRATTYDNYYAPIINLKTSYVLREEFTRRDVHDSVEEWFSDCDEVSSEWSEYRASIAKRTAVIGWMGVLIDSEHTGLETMTRAQARDAGVKPYPVMLYPANFMDWSIDRSGQFEWVKIKTSTFDRESWDADAERVESWTIWDRQRWVKYEKRGKRDPEEAGSGVHGLGIVPIAIYKGTSGVDDPVRANGLDDQIAEAARDHLNRKAEFTEHLRGQVFAVLVHVTDSSEDEINVGTDNALDLRSDAKNAHHYIAPPGSVAATFETRLENITRAIYRMGRVEYQVSGGNAASGLSKAYEFAQTNLALADFAGEIARGDEWVAQIVARWNGVSNAEIRRAKSIAPESFGVSDLAVDIQNAFDVIAGGVGARAETLIKRHLVRQIISNASPQDLEVIDAEIEDLVEEASRQSAADESFAEEAARLAAETAMGQGGSPTQAMEPDTEDDDERRLLR